MDSERRDRYAAAIEGAGGVVYPLDYYIEANAAMAVADQEIARVEVRRQEVVHALEACIRETARLRAECDAIEAGYLGQHDGVAVGARAAVIRIRACLTYST